MDIISIAKNTIDKIYRRRTHYPTSLQIGITNRCNLQCIMCVRTKTIEKQHLEYHKKNLSFDEFKYIVDQFPKLKIVLMTGPGENILNDDFIEMVEYANIKKIDVVFHDNFFLFDENISNKLINTKVHTVWASIDGATKETYEKIRPGSNFERVIDNIKTLNNIKKTRKSRFPFIKFNYVINKYNAGEVIDFINLVHSLMNNGAEINFQYLIDKTENKDIYAEIPDKIKIMAEKIADQFKIKLLWKNFSYTNCSKHPVPVIFPSGLVSPCCAAKLNREKEFLGNIFEQRFQKIWDSDNYKKFREDLKEGRVPNFCQNCI